MNDSINPLESPLQAITITDVAKKKAELGITISWVILLELPLFKLITAENHQPFNLGIRSQQLGHEGFAETTGSASDQKTLHGLSLDQAGRVVSRLRHRARTQSGSQLGRRGMRRNWARSSP